MKVYVSVVLAIFCALVVQSSAFWHRRCGGVYPYYFGQTNLNCMKKHGKRSGRAATRYVYDYSHRWIQYRGKFFEWGIRMETYNVGTHPFNADRCRYWRENAPAGYSNLSAECLERCTRSYRRQYGNYSLPTNNCHHFANKMSAILCHSTECPDWCV